MRDNQLKVTAENVILSLKTLDQRCALAAPEKGTSSRLMAQLIKRHGFTLDNGSFWDAIALRYGWHLRMTPSNCRCGKDFPIDHVLTCKHGGLHTVRHNELERHLDRPSMRSVPRGDEGAAFTTFEQ